MLGCRIAAVTAGALLFASNPALAQNALPVWNLKIVSDSASPAGPTVSGRRLAVLVIDKSRSMRGKDNEDGGSGEPRWNTAKGTVGQLPWSSRTIVFPPMPAAPRFGAGCVRWIGPGAWRKRCRIRCRRCRNESEAGGGGFWGNPQPIFQLQFSRESTRFQRLFRMKTQAPLHRSGWG